MSAIYSFLNNEKFFYHVLFANPSSSTNRIWVIVKELQGERSFLLVLPKSMAVALGISKGDYVKCRVQDGELVVKKSEE